MWHMITATSTCIMLYHFKYTVLSVTESRLLRWLCLPSIRDQKEVHVEDQANNLCRGDLPSGNFLHNELEHDPFSSLIYRT
jgi:hypothetical protein